jgi:hypothetical protein
MVRLILALPEGRNPGNEHAAERNLDHRSSRLDDMVTDQTRPIKRIPGKFHCVTTRPRKLSAPASVERSLFLLALPLPERSGHQQWQCGDVRPAAIPLADGGPPGYTMAVVRASRTAQPMGQRVVAGWVVVPRQDAHRPR